MEFGVTFKKNIFLKISRIWSKKYFYIFLQNRESLIPLFYTTLPYRLTYISLPSPRASLHYPSFSLFYTILLALYPTLLFLLSILHYTSFSSPSYTTLPFLYPTLPFLLTILHYPSFLDPLITFLLHPTLHFLLPILYCKPLLLSFLHYPSSILIYPSFSSRS